MPASCERSLSKISMSDYELMNEVAAACEAVCKPARLWKVSVVCVPFMQCDKSRTIQKAKTQKNGDL